MFLQCMGGFLQAITLLRRFRGHGDPYDLNTCYNIAGWEEERSDPTGKSFRFARACVRAVIVKWK